MTSKAWLLGLSILLIAVSGYGLTTLPASETEPEAPTVVDEEPTRTFELRTYVANEGKLDDLLARFRSHTISIFDRLDMKLVGFWVPQDEDKGKGDTLVYILSFPSREAAEASWKAFRSDPEWREVFAESRSNGPLVESVESVFLDPIDFSPIR